MNKLKLVVATGLLALLALPATHAAQVEQPQTVATRYDLSGRVTGVISPDSDGGGPLRYYAIRNTYDSRGLLTKSETGELSMWLDESIEPRNWGNNATFSVQTTREFTYDDNGFKTAGKLKGANGSIEALVQYSYDAQNLVRCKAVRMNPAAFASPPSDACSPGAEGTLGPDRVSRFTYDGFDQVLTEERAVGVSGLQQTYLTNTYSGRLLSSQKDANGNKTENRYDGYGRLWRRVYPSPTTANTVNESDYNEYTYDKAGNLKTDRKRSGDLITYIYDGNSRPIVKDLSNNSYSADVFYNYDLRGLLKYSRFGSDSGEGETNSFSGFGELTSRTNNVGGTSLILGYDYDENSNRRRITYPDGQFFEFAYDGLDRPFQLSESVSKTPTSAVTSALTLTYGADAKRVNILRPGAGTTSYTRDNAQRLDSFLQNFAVDSNDLTNVFSYNPAGQLTGLMQSNAQYNYNESLNKIGPYAPNGLNQYASVNSQPISYDTNGNLTGDGELIYTYDMENHLVSANGTVNGVAVTSSFVTDPTGRVTRATVNGVTTRLLYDGDALVSEYVGSTMTRRYVHGNLSDEPWIQYNSASAGSGARRYLYADHQGSIIVHTDGVGAVLSKLSYDSYGIPKSTNADRFGYTGQATFKELGLNYYKARFYSPRLGRFLQTDPIFYTDDMNLYAYVSNDPMSRIDPLGLSGVLTVHSSGDGGSSSTSGHSWVVYAQDGGPTTTYGTWGNHPEKGPNGLRENLERGQQGAASREAKLNDAQEAKLKALIAEYKAKGEKGWKLLGPCSTFAGGAWQAGTGEKLSTGFPSTPSTLMESIVEANGGESRGHVTVEEIPAPQGEGAPPTPEEDSQSSGKKPCDEDGTCDE